MTDLVLADVSSGYNLSLINSNFQAIQDAINDRCLQINGGHNTMGQALDMNSFALLNVRTDITDTGSMLTLGYANDHYYQIGLVPTAVNPADAVNYAQAQQMVTAAAGGLIPTDVALYSVLATSTGSGLLGYLTGTVKSFLDSLATDIGATLIKYKANFTGAIQRTLGQVAEDQINSAWFGADNTGATAASAKLQLGLTAAAGKVFVIKPGTYLLDATLLVSSYTTVIAYGCTFIRSGTLNCFIRNNANGVSGGYSANAGIKILGGKWDSTGGTGNCTVMALSHSSRCLIRDVEIYNENQWHHIETNACDNVLIEHCYFNGGYTTAFEGAEAVQIDCASDTTWPGPYDDTPCNNIVVTKCRFESVSNCVGSHTEPASINHSNIVVTECFANMVMEAFVKPLAWSDVKVLNNKVQNCGYGYLQLECTVTGRAQNDIEVIGNTFYMVGNTTFTRINSSAIQINGNATNTISRPINVRIANNFIYGVLTTGMHAISVQFVQRGTITGNVINTTQGCGIYCYGGSYLTVSGNSVSSNNSIANAGYASIKVGGTGLGTDTIRVTVTGNNCDTIIADYVNRTIVTDNVVNTSAALTNGSGGSVVIYNLIGTTWA